MTKLQSKISSLVEVDLDFVVKHKISLEQYTICYLLWQDKRRERDPQRHQGGDSHLSYIYKYFHALKDNDRIEGWKRRDIEYLEDIGFLENNNPQGKYSADQMQVTPKFVNAVMANMSQFEELWEAYPALLTIEPGRPKAKLKAVNDIDELERRYLRAVRTKKKHARVMKLLEWGKENEKITLGIQKFVNSRFWDQLQEMQDGTSEETSTDHETIIE